MSVPCKVESSGPPGGLYNVATPSADLDVLAFGQQYEAQLHRFRGTRRHKGGFCRALARFAIRSSRCCQECNISRIAVRHEVGGSGTRGIPVLCHGRQSSMGQPDARGCSTRRRSSWTPGGILLCHPHDESSDFLEHALTTGSTLRVCPFARDELPMPVEDSYRDRQSRRTASASVDPAVSHAALAGD